MTANKFKVPKKQWRKWGGQAKAVFNEVYSEIKQGYRCVFPESAQELPAQAIRVIAWNTAWIAASATQEFA